MALPDIKALTVSQVAAIKAIDDPTAVECAVLAYGYGVSPEAAAAWRDRAPAGVVEALVRLVMQLSGL